MTGLLTPIVLGAWAVDHLRSTTSAWALNTSGRVWRHMRLWLQVGVAHLNIADSWAILKVDMGFYIGL